ncbi:SDR family NAD(P)-dependent oxidoreductase, partial [Actinoplanes teichomyceticus]
TAYYALRDVAGLVAGESVLIHAAAGGVGMAATQLARLWGARVFATASPSKWGVLDVEPERLASSRSLEFAERFGPVDVVLNSLAGEFVDASLRLLAPGGRFVELGRTDVREPVGVRYTAFVLAQVDNDRIAAMLAELVGLFERGALRLLPVTGWDVRQAPAAFRFMSAGRHVGKNVFVLPREVAGAGTVLVTGGTGTLGRLVARRLVTGHGVRRLVVASRRGGSVPELAGLGAQVRVVACDLADRGQVADLVASIPDLCGVVHVAGVLDDGVITSLDARRLDTVFRPKVDAVSHLDELTRDRDLAMFVVFSSAAGTFESPGQGNYAAANAYLDALAQQRRHRGLPAISLGWGLWNAETSLSGHLNDTDQQRMARGGMIGLSVDEGMALFDTALGLPDDAVVLFNLDTAGLRDQPAVPALLRGLAGPGRRSARDAGAGADSLANRLARASSAEEQDRILLQTVQHEAASILGYASDEQAEPDRALHELGFDSLTSVELRNRLAARTGLRLPATLIFNYPTPAALAAYLRAELGVPDVRPGPVDDEEARRLLAAVPVARIRAAGLLDTLLDLARTEPSAGAAGPVPASVGAQHDLIDAMTIDDLVQRALDTTER